MGSDSLKSRRETYRDGNLSVNHDGRTHGALPQSTNRSRGPTLCRTLPLPFRPRSFQSDSDHQPKGSLPTAHAPGSTPPHHASSYGKPETGCFLTTIFRRAGLASSTRVRRKADSVDLTDRALARIVRASSSETLKVRVGMRITGLPPATESLPVSSLHCCECVLPRFHD